MQKARMRLYIYFFRTHQKQLCKSLLKHYKNFQRLSFFHACKIVFAKKTLKLSSKNWKPCYIIVLLIGKFLPFHLFNCTTILSICQYICNIFFASQKTIIFVKSLSKKICKTEYNFCAFSLFDYCVFIAKTSLQQKTMSILWTLF